ncbi:ATP-binding response regulator [Novipirellula artificiosorum]|uniref:histidine kinase n=1 Tax=Novipirellula artificiosorum TaxID=2528016 RepID=A0A5C6E4R7_9BACT|nr:ATP-binding protein [Novipirellula artificiosorum]TWU42571.1 Autoinducer 2 sensor kinase/phosphatase LuxQ [Novipirellula artificiosorum]
MLVLSRRAQHQNVHSWMIDIGRYAIAFLSTAVVIWFRWLLQPWLNEECPFSLFYLSVLLTAWVAGSGPAVLAITLGTLAAAHFFIAPASNLWIEGVPELVQLVIYVVVNCVAIFLFDRAERQRVLAENRAAENVRLGMDLQQADKRKDEFLALLAHELRNPLAPIRSSMALLERNEDAPKTVRRVREVIHRQTMHLIRITDDLLEVSRFCRGHIELLVQRFDLRASVDDAIEMIENAMSVKSQRFQYLIPDTPIWVNGDQVRLAQLTANLLGNASKYTPESGRITLVLERHDDTASIAISDTGIGFAADHAERIFEPFVQIDASRTREYGGLGVGLTIAKRLVDLHDGTLSAESRGPGLGSCFTVTLPTLNVGDGDCVGEDFLNGDDATENRTGRECFVAAKQPVCKLLLVDDNLDASLILRDLFCTEGYQVQLAHDGIEAISKAIEQSPAVIVMDIGLPGMDGYEVARRMRRSRQLSEVKLIALTGWGSSQGRELAAQAGFDLHLVKPIAFQSLLESVQSMQSQTYETTPCIADL